MSINPQIPYLKPKVPPGIRMTLCWSSGGKFFACIGKTILLINLCSFRNVTGETRVNYLLAINYLFISRMAEWRRRKTLIQTWTRVGLNLFMSTKSFLGFIFIQAYLQWKSLVVWTFHILSLPIYIHSLEFISAEKAGNCNRFSHEKEI